MNGRWPRVWPPGCWEQDATHFPRPVTRLWAEVFPRRFSAGYREGARRCGVLLDRFDWRVVDRFVYMAPVPLGAPRIAAARQPARHAFWVYRTFHPELRRRVRAAETLFERRPWRDDLVAWDSEIKPAAIRRQRALLAVPVDLLDGPELVEHIADCEDNLARLLEVRGRFTVPSMLPVGDFLAHAAEWTGMPVERLLALLRGASRQSVRPSELDRLLDALADSSDARASLERGELAALTGLVERDDTLARATRDYLQLVGYQVVGGYDVGEPYALELPVQLLAGLRRSLRDRAAANSADGGDEEVATILDAAPPARHRQLEELLAEARAIYRLRDERGLYGDLWAAGIMRRAMLSAGARLADDGAIDEPAHATEASPAELRALLLGDRGPTAAELAERFAFRLGSDADDVPRRLGPRFAGPPPSSWLPAAAARAAVAGATTYRAIFQFDEHDEAETATPLGAGPVSGRPASGGVYEGTARVVGGPADFGAIADGDVLVARATSASFTVVLPLLGAIVTDRGGALSHAAIVAREYGIPAVVGCGDATRRLPDGARVRVRGDDGTVELVP